MMWLLCVKMMMMKFDDDDDDESWWCWWWWWWCVFLNFRFPTGLASLRHIALMPGGKSACIAVREKGPSKLCLSESKLQDLHGFFTEKSPHKRKHHKLGCNKFKSWITWKKGKLPHYCTPKCGVQLCQCFAMLLSILLHNNDSMQA